MTTTRLRLVRSYFTELSTIGLLYHGSRFICYTLEDKVREAKIPGLTAIPAGVYEVQVTWSPKFGQPMPILVGVPGYTGVRIHWGNTADDTSGCLLVGMEKGQDKISRSREAYSLVYPMLSGGGTISIEDSLNKPKAALAAAGITASLWAMYRLARML